MRCRLWTAGFWVEGFALKSHCWVRRWGWTTGGVWHPGTRHLPWRAVLYPRCCWHTSLSLPNWCLACQRTELDIQNILLLLFCSTLGLEFFSIQIIHGPTFFSHCIVVKLIKVWVWLSLKYAEIVIKRFLKKLPGVLPVFRWPWGRSCFPSCTWCKGGGSGRIWQHSCARCYPNTPPARVDN